MPYSSTAPVPNHEPPYVALIVDNNEGSYQWRQGNNLRSRTSVADLRPMAAAILESPHHITVGVTGQWRSGVDDRLLERGCSLTVNHGLANDHDRNACSVWLADTWVGYLPASSARILAPYLDAGYEVQAFLLQVGDGSSWSMEVLLVGNEPVLALQEGRRWEEAIDAAAEIKLWKPPGDGWSSIEREQSAWKRQVKQRCDRRGLDIFVALNLPDLPQYRIDPRDRYWNVIDLMPKQENWSGKPAFDQDLDDEIPF